MNNINTLKDDFPEAFEYLDQIEKNINDKIISLNTVEQVNIPLIIPNDQELELFINNLKQKLSSERNQFIADFISNQNYNINDTNEKYSTYSESSKKEQMK